LPAYIHSDTNPIGLFDEDKNEERVEIDSLDALYDHAEHLRRTVRYYEEGTR